MFFNLEVCILGQQCIYLHVVRCEKRASVSMSCSVYTIGTEGTMFRNAGSQVILFRWRLVMREEVTCFCLIVW